VESSPNRHLIDSLRAQAARAGVIPSDADLEAVLGFLTRILPALEEIDRRLPPELGPADPGVAEESG
jgi:hypothetical protein